MMDAQVRQLGTWWPTWQVFVIANWSFLIVLAGVSVAQKTDSLTARPSVALTPRRNAALRQVLEGEHVAGPSSRGGISRVRNLQVVGRFVYSPSGTSEISGVDTILVEIRDDDVIGHSVLWSGYTDQNGYFDTGVVDISDDDNEPDLYVYFETNSPYVSVEDGDIISDHYSWDSFDTLLVEDFSGEFIDFGTHAPAVTGVGSNIPALDMLQIINRAHRFVLRVTNLNISKVNVLWPSGDDFGYDYDGEMSLGEFIYLNPQILHLYAHHLERTVGMVVSASNNCTNDCQYCDSGGTDCSTPVDCAWCPMTPDVARSEGFADWFPTAVARALMARYAFDSGEPYRISIGAYHEFFPPEIFPDDPFDDVSDLSEIRAFCGADALDNADRVIYVVAALLEDFADDTIDDHAGDGLDECANLTDGTLLTTYLIDKPANVLALIDQLILDFPNDLPALYSAAQNMAPLYTARFPNDVEPPGVVSYVRSPSHPIGEGGTLPCITLDWQLPVDDVTGACAYSYLWTTDSAGLEPDPIENLVTSCTLTHGPFDLGEHYISLRARDCADHWSDDWDVFGPFEVTDCNSNSVLDICDLACLPNPEYFGECLLGDSCLSQPFCGTASDCNFNRVPDDCDVSDGTSDDCNENGVPDECEEIYHWSTDGASWGEVASWVENQLPIVGSDVCIDVPGDATASIAHATIDIGILACEETINLASSGLPWPSITLNEPSWIRGDLRLHGKTSWFRVNDQLDVWGQLLWTGSNDSNVASLTGSGITRVWGGATLASVMPLDGHGLIFETGCHAISTGRIYCYNGATVEIKPGATYEHRGATAFTGSTGELINNGTILKTVNTGNSDFNVKVTNNGLLHIQTGTLTLRNGCYLNGTLLAAPGTTFKLYGAGHGFSPTNILIAEKTVIDGWATIHGTYNVSESTTKTDSGTLTFADDCDVANYGSSFYLDNGKVYFNSLVGGPIHFDYFRLGTTSVGGTVYFDSGVAIDMDEFRFNKGTVRGSSDITINTTFHWGAGASFYDAATINVNGDMTVGSGSSAKTLSDREMHIHGSMTMSGGFNMSGAASLHIYPDAVVDINHDSNGGAISGSAGTPMTNEGLLKKSAGEGVNWIKLPFTNRGIIELQSGTLTFARHRLVQTDGQIILNGGTLATWNVTQFGNPALQIEGGVVTGSGIITDNYDRLVSNYGGTFAPGLSVGLIHIDGRYSQGLEGTLEIELRGSLPGEFDVLEIMGTATLAGELHIIELGGYVPPVGTTFVVLTASSVTGQFDSVVGPAGYTVQYNATDVTLVAIAPSDFDVDDDVDLYDVSRFLLCFGGSGSPPGQNCPNGVDADLDPDGDVDKDDWAIFVGQFQNGPE